jgi:peptidoglycan/LPS O-acetylase OafA/YrhL
MSPWFRIIDFTLGVLAALAIRRGLDRKYVRIVAPLASVAAFAVVCLHLVAAGRGEWLSPHLQFATGLLFAMIIAGANADTRMNRILSSRALILTGTVSYSLYLFHFLAADAFGPEHSEDFSARGVVITLFRTAAMIPLSIVIAATLYVVVEKPGKLWLRRLLLSPLKAYNLLAEDQHQREQGVRRWLFHC